MIRRNWGRVIFVSSEAAAEVHPDMIHYGVTKTGQLVVSRGLAEMAQHQPARQLSRDAETWKSACLKIDAPCEAGLQ